MHIPRQVQTRSVIILLVIMLLISGSSIYYVWSASTPTSGLTDIYINPPMHESSYVIGIYTAPLTCFLQNGTTGQITTTGSFYTCLQAAVDALKFGGRIFIRSGNYTLAFAITIGGIGQGGDGIYIEGEGIGLGGSTDMYGTQIFYTSATPSPAFMWGSASGHRYFGGLKNLLLVGPSTAAYYGVQIYGFWSDLTFENVMFQNFDIGAYLRAYNVGTTSIWNIWFQHCFFEDNLKYGVYFGETYTVATQNIDRVKISNCHFYNNKNSVFSDSQYVYHVEFTDNTVQAEQQASINVTSGGRQWTISDNFIFDCGISANGTMAAIMVNGTGTYYPDSWIISNNIIGNHFTGSPAATNNSIWLTGTVTSFVVSDNFFYSASEAVRQNGLTPTSFNYYLNNVNCTGQITSYMNSTDPSTSGWGALQRGFMWFNTADGKYKYWDGSAVQVLPSVTGSGSGNYTLGYTYTIYKSGSTYYAEDRYGNIPYSSTNCSLLVGQAITAALALTNPGGLHFLGGTYSVDSPFPAITKDMVVSGEGIDATVFDVTANLGTYLFCFYNGATVTLRDFTIIMNQYTGQAIFGDRIGAGSQSCNIYGRLDNLDIRLVKAGYWAIYMINPSYMMGSNLHLGSYGGGIRLSNNHTSGTNRGNSEFTFVDIVLAANNGVAVQLDSRAVATNGIINLIQFNNLQIYANPGLSNTTGIYLYDAMYNTFRHMDIENMVDDITLDGAGTSSCAFNNFDYVVYASAYNNTIWCKDTNARGNMFKSFYCVGKSGSTAVMINDTGATGYDGNTYDDIRAIGTYWATTYISVHARDHLRGTTGHGGLTAEQTYSQNYGSEASCINGSYIAHGLWTTPSSITLGIYGTNPYFNTTAFYFVPTILSSNATHFQISFCFLMGGVVYPVTAVEAATIHWDAFIQP